jgi:hypothetical protein
MMRNVAFGACLAVFSLLSLAVAWAGDGVCSHCRRCCECQKVCRVVCEMKEVTKTTYSCKCEDFCVPGKSCRVDNACSCGHCADCRKQAWVPTAAYIKTRKVPVKHVEKKLVPTYKLVVEYVCPQCAGHSK